MKTRNKLKILFSVFIMTIISLGCIESHKPSAFNETEIATPSITEQKLPVPNATEPLKINDTFVTWSRGYYSNFSYERPYFRVITNYSAWIAFLNEQGYFDYIAQRGPLRLEGILFPGQGVMPKTIEPLDFNNYFVIAAMMGLTGHAEGPEIEIKNITRMNNLINVKVRMVRDGGALTYSSPYHIVIIKREILSKGNSTFVFIDTEGKELGKVEVNE